MSRAGRRRGIGAAGGDAASCVGRHPKWAVAERGYSDLERTQVSERGRKSERDWGRICLSDIRSPLVRPFPALFGGIQPPGTSVSADSPPQAAGGPNDTVRQRL